MSEFDTLPQSTVIRDSCGLSIAGTRITLYDIMDHVTEGLPPNLIKLQFDLTERQISDVMDYIETHRKDVEAEYELVLQQAEESRLYWEERNRERFARIAAMPPKPGEEQIRAKLAEWKARLNMR